ncbi:hypothetical protein BA062_05875 [Prauserella flavalba]|uniref:Uncharacterized protein n=1 Tax=Prauserella flavalba TaxID=1477506 RepID=A0A318LRV1_9PSEU|nr:hypothetical protein BA062_05875 [Prauserella flavalba]
MTVLAGVLILGVPSATASAAPATAQPVVAAAPALTQTEPGPVLDPQNEADARNSRNKLVVGVAAAVLLGIVIWGRHIRSKKKPKKK